MKDVSLWCMYFEIRASIESSYFFSTEANIFLINIKNQTFSYQFHIKLKMMLCFENQIFQSAWRNVPF